MRFYIQSHMTMVYFSETPVETGRAEDYRLKLSLGKRASNTKYEYKKTNEGLCT